VYRTVGAVLILGWIPNVLAQTGGREDLAAYVVGLDAATRASLDRRASRVCGNPESDSPVFTECRNLGRLRSEIRTHAAEATRTLTRFYESLPRPARRWLVNTCNSSSAPGAGLPDAYLRLSVCFRRMLGEIPSALTEGVRPPYQRSTAQDWLQRFSSHYRVAASFGGVCAQVTGSHRLMSSGSRVRMEVTGAPLDSTCRARLEVPGIDVPPYRPVSSRRMRQAQATAHEGLHASGGTSEGTADGSASGSVSGTLSGRDGGRPLPVALPRAVSDCPYVDRMECVGGSPVVSTVSAYSSLSDAQQMALQASAEVLKEEAGKFVLRAGMVGYLRQVGFYARPATRDRILALGQSLASECASSNPRLALELSNLTRDAVASLGSDAQISDARARREAEVAVAAERLRALEGEYRTLAADFQSPPFSLADRWPSFLPGITVAQVLDVGNQISALDTRSERACNPAAVMMGADVPVTQPTRADRWMESMGYLRGRGERALATVSARCNAKARIMEEYARQMAAVLSEYPELGESYNEQPAYRALGGLREGHQRLSDLEGSYERTDDALSRMHEGVLNICEDPDEAGASLFANPDLASDFLSCGGRLPVPVSMGAPIPPGTPSACQEARQHAAAACFLEAQARNSSARTEVLLGSLGAGMDILSLFPLARMPFAAASEGGLLAAARNSFSASALRSAAGGAAVGLGIGLWGAREQVRGAEDATRCFYSGGRGCSLQQYQASVRAADGAYLRAFRDALLGAVIGRVEEMGSTPRQGAGGRSLAGTVPETPPTRLGRAASHSDELVLRVPGMRSDPRFGPAMGRLLQDAEQAVTRGEAPTWSDLMERLDGAT
jgi:hypothetical protein